MDILKRKRSVVSLVIFLVCMSAVSIDYTSMNLFAFHVPNISDIILSLLAVVFICDKEKLKKQECVLAFIYALFLLIGRGFINYEWDQRNPLEDGKIIIKWLLSFPGYYLITVVLVHKSFSIIRKSSTKYFNNKTIWLDRHPLLYPFLILLVLQVPSFIFCFPGIMIPADNVFQINQVTSTFINHELSINLHHPILHTLMLGGFIWGGKWILGSETIGYGLFTLFQLIFITLAIARMLCFLQEQGIAPQIRLILLMFFGLNPVFTNMYVTTTKDIWYVAFLIFFIIEITKIIQRDGNDLRTILCGIGVVLFRNEGIFVALFSVLSLILFSELRKNGIIIGLSLVVLHLFLGNILYPAFGIKPGSPREALAIPMQTMAKYVIGHEGEWTNEEQEIIGRVLDIENMEEWYDTSSVDPIKYISNVNAKQDLTRKDILSFLTVWIKLGMRHPITYFDGFLDLKNQFLYPTKFTGVTDASPNVLTTENSQYSLDALQFQNLYISYPPNLNMLRTTFETARSKMHQLPIIRTFCISPTYIWFAIGIVCFFIEERSKNAIPLCILILTMLFVVFASPLDGYDFRYVFPLAIILPFCGLINLKLGRGIR